MWKRAVSSRRVLQCAGRKALFIVAPHQRARIAEQDRACTLR